MTTTTTTTRSSADPAKQSAAFEVFRRLHDSGTFVMPNPHDLGATRILSTLGFPALATTSAGFAASLGQLDMTITRDQLVAHVAAICAATDLPVNVDAERCFPEASGGITRTIELLAEAGAAGCSIEDWNPLDQRIEPVDIAVEKIAEAAAAAKRVGVVLTARAENHIRGVHDLDDTVARLERYAEAGADALYSPGLTKAADIQRVVAATPLPINVLLLAGGPSINDLTNLGVRRISLGSGLSNIAYGAFARAAERLLTEGILPADESYLPRELAARAFRTA
jgi:2-methylisocitrate lyase-like PEP mutase family enzyme